MPAVFLGYDQQPPVNRATLHDAARSLGDAHDYPTTSWEDLRIGGQVVIGRITAEIDASEIALFDLTTLNPNVLFELGYAIAKRRRVGILLESGSTDAVELYKRFGLLRSAGYSRWSDTDSIVGLIRSGEFDDQEPLGDALLENARTLDDSTLFFLPAVHRTEPDGRLRKLVQRAADQRVEVVIADPSEARVEPLNWYTSRAYASGATLLHFESPRRVDHQTHNARLALIGGMVHGFGRHLLMLADESYDVPFDYQDLLRTYTTPAGAEAVASAWLETLSLEPAPPVRRPQLELAVELRSLTFGEHVAENEVQRLPQYFIETAQYQQVLSSHLSVFIGRKGTGKSANLYLAAAQLRSDRRNLVVVVRPAAYDFEGLVDVVSRHSEYMRSYAIEGMWKLLLLSEVARALADQFSSRDSYLPLTVEQQNFMDGIANGPIDVQADFGSRIDSAIRSLLQLDVSETTVSETRDRINEALHSEWIGRLRRLIAPVLAPYERVAVLVDNLDKGWERSADLGVLSDVLLGLLGAIGRVERELTRRASRVGAFGVSLAAFVRSDIFGYVKERAREPDKIVTSAVEWQDRDVLRRVIEERYLATRRSGTDVEELWNRYFCSSLDGIATKDYLLSVVLPRPRDLIYLCNAATGIAINRRHSRIEAEDILAARSSYSQFAFEALLVENGITVEELEFVLLEFLGVAPIIDRDEVFRLISNVGFDGMKAESVFQRLKSISFLGIEVRPGEFQYPEIGRPTEKAEILARKNALSEGQTRYSVHSAYRPFLEIADH